ncbi:MAG: MAPEG family protein [Pseudomonadota bacterium]
MSDELSILALYGLVITGIVVLNILTAIPQAGLMTLAGSRDDMPPLTGLPARVLRTLDNSVVAMVLFAPAILLLAHKEAFTDNTLLAAQVFLIARILFIPVYAFSIPVPFLRTTIWTVGCIAVLSLYIAAL